MNKLLMTFLGDDFTGSTDAMESLARSGIPTALFTAPPTPAQLAKYDHVRAVGIAGMTRSMSPGVMEQTLRPALERLRELGAPIVHYKVCSTFDSSPTIGSIGRAIDVGADLFRSRFIPIVAGAPALGRYCVFGNLFARSGPQTEPYRLDRHPSMSRHPVTPMDEADLRRHLSRQTGKTIALLDVLALDGFDPQRVLHEQVARGAEAVLIDVLQERHLEIIGRLLAGAAGDGPPLFVVGSSGVEAALAAHWRVSGMISDESTFLPPGQMSPIVAVCGSCSPVTAAQIRHAVANGFVEAADLQTARDVSIDALCNGRSVVIHTGMGEPAKQVSGAAAEGIGPTLGRILRDVLDNARVRRVIVAGGDTSGSVARALGIEALEVIAELTRGSPLCRANAPGSPAEGVEFTFKGGQIGPVDFFTQVAQGRRDEH